MRSGGGSFRTPSPRIEALALVRRASTAPVTAAEAIQPTADRAARTPSVTSETSHRKWSIGIGNTSPPTKGRVDRHRQIGWRAASIRSTTRAVQYVSPRLSPAETNSLRLSRNVTIACAPYLCSAIAWALGLFARQNRTLSDEMRVARRLRCGWNSFDNLWTSPKLEDIELATGPAPMEIPMEARIARIEADVAHLRSDVADIKVDIRARFDRMDGRMDRMDARMDRLDRGSMAWIEGRRKSRRAEGGPRQRQRQARVRASLGAGSLLRARRQHARRDGAGLRLDLERSPRGRIARSSRAPRARRSSRFLSLAARTPESIRLGLALADETPDDEAGGDDDRRHAHAALGLRPRERTR